MRPVANARTDPKVYVDCHGDYRISATIYTNRLSVSRDFNIQFVECFVVVCGIVDDAVRLINQTLCSAVLGRVIDIRFVIISAWQLAIVIIINIAANHHTKRSPRIKIPFIESLSSLRLVQGLSFVFADIVARQFIELAEVRGHGIFCSVQAGFFHRFVNRLCCNAG